MSVLFFEPYSYFVPHFGTALEIAEDHIEDGDEVIFVGCNGQITSCDVNIHHKKLRCIRCKSIRKAGYKLLSKDIIIENGLKLNHQDKQKLNSLTTEFASFDDLKEYKFDDFDIGYAVISSLIWVFRNPDLDIDENRQLISNLIHSSAKLYFSTINYISEYKPDRVYIFNGRLAILRGILRYCQTNQIECYVHERGSNMYKYSIYENNMPHNIQLIANKIKEAWDAEDAGGRVKIGEGFFMKRAKGLQENWTSFVKDQQENLLPSDWDETKKNIVIYTSSEDEFAAIGDEWNYEVYDNQVDGIKSILESFVSRPEFHFYIRMHPYLRGVYNHSTNSIYELTYPNLTCIIPESEISSYSMLNACDQIITFGSTIGIEASYWMKPSILLAPSFYQHLNATYNPKTHEEVISLIESDLPAKERIGALQYGHYFDTYGKPFHHYKPADFEKGSFNGVQLEEEWGLRQLVLLNNWIKSKRAVDE